MSIKGFIELHDYYTHAPFIVNVNAIESVSDRLIIYAQSGHNVDERYDEILKLIEAAPAADVAEVVHGEWILLGKNEHDYETSVEEKCSLCGRYVYRYDTELQDSYCPNCGAKMDKEDET